MGPQAGGAGGGPEQTVNPTGIQLDGFLTRLETRLGNREHQGASSITAPTTAPHAPPATSGASPSVSGGGKIAGATMPTASSSKEHRTLFWG